MGLANNYKLVGNMGLAKYNFWAEIFVSYLARSTGFNLTMTFLSLS